MDKTSEINDLLTELRCARTGYIEAQIGVESGYRGLFRKMGMVEDSENEEEVSYLHTARKIYYEGLDSYRKFLLENNIVDEKFILELTKETVFDEMAQLRNEKEVKIRINGVRGLLRTQIEDWREIPPAFKMSIGAFFAISSIALGLAGIVSLIWLKGALLGLGAILFIEGFSQRSHQKKASAQGMNRATAFKKATASVTGMLKNKTGNYLQDIMTVQTALEDDISAIRKYEKKSEVKRYALSFSLGMVAGFVYLIPTTFVSGVVTLVQTAGMIAFSRIVWMAMPQGAMAATPAHSNAFSAGEGVAPADLVSNDQYVNYFSRAPMSDAVVSQAAQNQIAFNPTDTGFVAMATAGTASLAQPQPQFAVTNTYAGDDSPSQNDATDNSDTDAVVPAVVAKADRSDNDEKDNDDNDKDDNKSQSHKVAKKDRNDDKEDSPKLAKAENKTEEAVVGGGAVKGSRSLAWGEAAGSDTSTANDDTSDAGSTDQDHDGNQDSTGGGSGDGDTANAKAGGAPTGVNDSHSPASKGGGGASHEGDIAMQTDDNAVNDNTSNPDGYFGGSGSKSRNDSGRSENDGFRYSGKQDPEKNGGDVNPAGDATSDRHDYNDPDNYKSDRSSETAKSGGVGTGNKGSGNGGGGGNNDNDGGGNDDDDRGGPIVKPVAGRSVPRSSGAGAGSRAAAPVRSAAPVYYDHGVPLPPGVMPEGEGGEK